MICDSFLTKYYAESLGKEISVWFTFLDHSPNEGIYYEFEMELLDKDGKDFEGQITSDEYYEICDMVRERIKEMLTSPTDYH